MNRLRITWDFREKPLVPAAALGRGAIARRLAAAVRPEAIASLRVVASAEALLVIGDANNLPWVDGVCYLGREEGLLVPTTRVPLVPAGLLRAALAEAMPDRDFALVEGRVLAYPAPTAGADPGWLQNYSRGTAS